MSDGAPTIHTVSAQLAEAKSEYQKLEDTVAGLCRDMDNLKPRVITAQRITEIRLGITSGAGCKLRQDELMDMLTVCTKVLYLLQGSEEIIDEISSRHS